MDILWPRWVARIGVTRIDVGKLASAIERAKATGVDAATIRAAEVDRAAEARRSMTDIRGSHLAADPVRFLWACGRQMRCPSLLRQPPSLPLSGAAFLSSFQAA